MGVVKIGGKWGIDYYDNGQRYRKVVGDGSSFTLAKKALCSVKTRIAEGIYLPNKIDNNVLLKEILEYYWTKRIEKKRNGFHSESIYKRLKEEFGHIPLRNLTKERIVEYQQRRANEKRKNGKFFQPQTINNEIIFLKGAINYALKMGKISGIKNPCSNIEPLEVNNTRDVVLTYKEFERLMSCLPAFLKPFTACAYYTGCRKSEISGLLKSDVNLFNNTIHIRSPKNGESRFVPIAKPLREILLPLVTTGAPTEYVFRPRRNKKAGKPITDFAKVWRSACEKAELK
ncbi:MAG: tyrosine-type recombinase/integrase, partial [Fibrobacteres bacterium]|nr:tyrosine-type recombinase/integrase [Fibrobacterota bacterium]